MSSHPSAGVRVVAPPTTEELRAVFEAPVPLTVGLEEELFLLEPDSLDLAPCARQVLERVADSRFKLELPAAQIEVVTPPHAEVPAAAAELAACRRRLAQAAAPLARPAGVGVHPFAAPEGVLDPGQRYEQMRSEYGSVARRQLVAALQVHVAVGGADRTLAVYNELRGYLPEIAALAANAPFHGGRDTGLASVRPKISDLLPRQGIPPAFASWEAFARELQWGAAAGALPSKGLWWWELRPHPLHGTLELRVPDTQATVADAAAVAAIAQALVASLVERYDAGESLQAPDTWRIEENRWSAAAHGVEGKLADLRTGEQRLTRDRLHSLLDELRPFTARLRSGGPLEHARSLIERNGAMRQREVAVEGGMLELANWLTERFLDRDGAGSMNGVK